MHMYETAKLVLICTLYFEGIESKYGDVQPSNDVAILEEITIYETGWLNNNTDQGQVEIISYATDQLYPQTKWYEDYRYETTYTVSEGGNYYFKTYYENISEDEDKLEITENKAKIEYAIDPETLKYKSTYIELDEEGNEDEDAEPDYGHCVPVHQKEV